MSFMQAQITKRQLWMRVETDNGTAWIPSDLLGNLNTTRKEAIVQLQQYVGDPIMDYEPIIGYGVRASAPGYLDCTEWTVYADERDAIRAYNELRAELAEEDF